MDFNYAATHATVIYTCLPENTATESFYKKIARYHYSGSGQF
jgi:hypothetical protein